MWESYRWREHRDEREVWSGENQCNLDGSKMANNHVPRQDLTTMQVIVSCLNGASTRFWAAWQACPFKWHSSMELALAVSIWTRSNRAKCAQLLPIAGLACRLAAT